MKKYLIIFLIPIFLIPLFTYNVSYSEAKNSTIIDDFILLSLDFSQNPTQSIEFSISNDLFDKCSMNENDRVGFVDNLIKKVDTIRTEYLLNLTLKYIQNPIEEYKLNKGVVLSQVVYNETLSIVGFKIIYNGFSAFNYYNSNGNSSNLKNDGNIFINKYVSKSIFPFCKNIVLPTGTETLAQRYKDIFISTANNTDYYQKISENYNPVFVYDYVTLGNGITSNANYEIKNGDYKHFIWTVKEENISSNPNIELTLTIINRGWWFLLALIVVTILLFLLILFIYRKEVYNFFHLIRLKIKFKK